MGNPKQKWTAEEEDALRAGVIKHGTGKWKNIQKDPEFNHYLYSRSNIDLKDKWRNMCVGPNGLPNRPPNPPKQKQKADGPATTVSVSQTPNGSNTDTSNNINSNNSTLVSALTNPTITTNDPSASVSTVAATMDTVMVDESSKCILDGKTASKYNAMITEALETLKDPNGSDTSAIVSFIEKRNEVPPNFRRLLSARLRRLVAQDKLEKVQNCYRIPKHMLNRQKGLTPKAKDNKAKVAAQTANNNSNIYNGLGETLQDAAIQAAYKIAEAENKSFVAAEAVKEAERVAKMAEDADAMVELSKEIYDRCQRGEIVCVN
jgi:myb proto-oncogene protein